MVKKIESIKVNQKSLLLGAILLVFVMSLATITGLLLNENKRLKSELSLSESKLTISESKYTAFIKNHTTSGSSEFTENIKSIEMHNLVNAERKNAGLYELAYIPSLENSACLKAEHMIQNNYWAHVAPDGTQPWYFFQKAGVYYDRAGENLAYGFSTSYAVVVGWMRSPKHKANIVGDYSGEGICVRNAPKFQNGKNVVVVQHFYK
jgi:uncharacterized protein YkwD